MISVEVEVDDVFTNSQLQEAGAAIQRGAYSAFSKAIELSQKLEESNG